MKERLQKIIANAGYCSRRKAEILIKEGRVQVNGQTADLGSKCEVDSLITIDGVPLEINTKKHYLMFNKPKNVICSNYDPQKRLIINDYLPNIKERIYPIGRLDYDATGLLLLTNDGQFANQIMHPRYAMPKTYLVTIKHHLAKEQQNRLLAGVWIESNFKTTASYLQHIHYHQNSDSTSFEITIFEGRNHQIKKMMIAVNCQLLRLKRIKIGSIRLDRRLQTGEYRQLTNFELKKLKKY